MLAHSGQGDGAEPFWLPLPDADIQSRSAEGLSFTHGKDKGKVLTKELIPGAGNKGRKQGPVTGLPLPEMAQDPEEQRIAVQGIEVDEMSKGQDTVFLGALAKAVVFHDGRDIFFPSSIARGDIVKEQGQLAEHHGTGSVDTCAA